MFPWSAVTVIFTKQQLVFPAVFTVKSRLDDTGGRRAGSDDECATNEELTVVIGVVRS